MPSPALFRKFNFCESLRTEQTDSLVVTPTDVEHKARTAWREAATVQEIRDA
ncbi:MAG: hypothetical protein ACI9NC_003655, partial [Verrucomicrobiales bacterium]